MQIYLPSQAATKVPVCLFPKQHIPPKNVPALYTLRLYFFSTKQDCSSACILEKELYS